MTEKEREQIALFRFSIISPILTGQESNAAAYFAQVSAQKQQVPVFGEKDYSPKTMANWLHRYRKFGFEGLKPAIRSDKNKSRSITGEIEQMLLEERQLHPDRSCRLFYDQLCLKRKLSPSEISYSTVYRYLKQHALIATTQRKEGDRKRFAYDKINVLWQGDTMYGPYLNTRGRKTRTYLLAFIDDCSRIITHGCFLTQETTGSVATVLKEAILRRGVPRIVYVDNGRVYRNEIIAFACANLGISLAHTPVRDGSSKGKIERFFRTVRSRFLPLLDLELNKIQNVDVLNQRFFAWLETDYHRKIHSALGMSPLDKFMSQIDRVRHLQEPALLERVFMKRVFRKVKHDATVSIDSRLYEVNPVLIGQKIEVRFDPDQPEQVFVYEQGREIQCAPLCSQADNARIKRKGKAKGKKALSFSRMLGDEHV